MDQNTVSIDKSEDYVFISYSHRDMERVKPLIVRLLNDGYSVWYDEGIDPGTEWDENIARHLKECSGIIAFISGNYLESENCRDEINYARDLGKERLIVYLEDSELPAGMAMRLNRIQAIHKYKYKNEDAFYSELVKAPMLKDRRISPETVTKAVKPSKAASEEVTPSDAKPLTKKDFIKLPEYRTLANIILIAALTVYILSPVMILFGEYYGTPVVLIFAAIGHYKLNYRFVIPAAAIAVFFGIMFLPYMLIHGAFAVILILGLRKAEVLYKEYVSSGKRPRFELLNIKRK